jgi:hypothetical protein
MLTLVFLLYRDCNAQYTTKKNFFVPVIFHNFRGYDEYHILRGVAPFLKKISQIKVIAKTIEKYTSISIDCIKFIDSLQFLKEKLETLAKNLYEGYKDDEAKRREAFAMVEKDMMSMCEGLTYDQLKPHIYQKGIYPYEYVKSFDTLLEEQLPPKEAFWSQVNNEGISDEDYARAQHAWQSFGCTTLADYTEAYCLLDTLLLATVFEKFRDGCIAEGSYLLDPLHFLTAPGLTWQAMLFHLYRSEAYPVLLENISDIDMLYMIQAGVRGGLCQVMIPYAKANIPFRDDFDPDERPSLIFYWDANNLYGWAMSQYLPIDNFRWILNDSLRAYYQGCLKPCTKREYERLRLRVGSDDVDEVVEFMKILPDDNEYGYILEVDIQYPVELHDLHQDYPLCASSRCVTPSPFTMAEAKRLGLNVGGKVPKLVMDLNNKEKYIMHYRTLKQALTMGLRLTKVHRIIEFRQSPWLRSYIEFNTEKRKYAKNAVEKDLFKLMNNAVFGKFLVCNNCCP